MAEYRQQRKAPRIRVASRPWGRIPGALEYRLVDLSIAGARIEHQAPLDPGSTWGLELPLAFGSMSLQARVVHTGPVGDAQVRDADALLRYQSGLAFFGMSLEQQTTLTRRLNTLYPPPEAGRREMAREASCEGETVRLGREGHRLVDMEG